MSEEIYLEVLILLSIIAVIISVLSPHYLREKTIYEATYHRNEQGCWVKVGDRIHKINCNELPDQVSNE